MFTRGTGRVGTHPTRVCCHATGTQLRLHDYIGRLDWMWIESRLILSAPNPGHVKSGLKVDWVNPRTVGGLKWINVDSGIIISGLGFCDMTA